MHQSIAKHLSDMPVPTQPTWSQTQAKPIPPSLVFFQPIVNQPKLTQVSTRWPIVIRNSDTYYRKVWIRGRYNIINNGRGLLVM